VIERTGSAPGVPTGHRIPAQGNALGTVRAFTGVLKERRIFLNRGRLPKPTRCGVPSERLIGGPRIPRVAPWAGMRRPFRAEADMPPLLISRANRLWSSHQKFVSGVTQMSATSLFCQPESVMTDFAKALPALSPRHCPFDRYEPTTASEPRGASRRAPTTPVDNTALLIHGDRITPAAAVLREPCRGASGSAPTTLDEDAP
jgi:hypothetical protein